jgi:predicted alpha/beta superfamily hydrolase
LHIVEVVELLSQPHRRALHGQQVLGPGDEDAQVRQLQIRVELAARAQEALHGIVQPVLADSRTDSYACGRASNHRCRSEGRVNIACRWTRLERETHDRATHEIHLSLRTIGGELRIEQHIRETVGPAGAIDLDGAVPRQIKRYSTPHAFDVCAIQRHGRTHWRHGMRSLGCTLAAAICIATPAHAQADANAASPTAPLVMGETFTIHSKTLDETRRINVYLPPIYKDSASVRLPVLYMPDGGMGEDFLHVAGLVQVSVGNGTMRPFILVGIENTKRRRDLTGPTRNADDRKIAPQVGGAAAFRKFIRTELMPIVNARYRTTKERAIVGESLAGLFILETFFLEPDLFDTYIAFDPSLWWNDHALVDSAAVRLHADKFGKRTLFLANSSQDIDQLTKVLADTLAGYAPSDLTWYYQPMMEETHATIYHPAALIAFRRVFKPASASH